MLLSQTNSFDYKVHCILCGHVVDKNAAHKYRDRKALQYSEIQCLKVQNTLIACCEQRQDSWAQQVQVRLLSINDLPAEEALYHSDCFQDFSKGSAIPSHRQLDDISPLKKARVGRPKDVMKLEHLT